MSFEEPTMTKQQIERKRMVLLALSTLILLFIGLIYAFSMFAKPMVQDFGLVGDIGLTFNIMMITFCIGAVAGSAIERKLGVRASLIVCAILFGVGFCGTGLLAAAGGMTVLYVFYGVLGGFGVGIGYNTIVSTTNLWFPDKVGFSSGILMMGFGVSSLLFGNLSLLARPLIGGMGPTLIALGIFVVVLVLVSAGQLKRPPADIVAIMAPEKITAANGGAEIGENDVVFKTPIFYIYYVWSIIVIAIGLAVIGNCASDATTLGVDMAFATLLVGLVSTFNGLSRVVIGALYDKTNIIVTMFVDGLVGFLAVASIVGAFSLNTPALYIVGALFCGFAYGGVPVVSSTFARQRFGSKRYPFNLSIVNFAITFGSILNLVVAAAVGSSNRLGVFSVMLALGVIALLDIFAFAKVWKRDVPQEEHVDLEAEEAL